MNLFFFLIHLINASNEDLSHNFLPFLGMCNIFFFFKKSKPAFSDAPTRQTHDLEGMAMVPSIIKQLKWY